MAEEPDAEAGPDAVDALREFVPAGEDPAAAVAARFVTRVHTHGPLALRLAERRSKYAFLENGLVHCAALDDQTVPQCVWPVSAHLNAALVARADALAGKRVLELGSGTGICGLVAAQFAAAVTLTDVDPVSLALCRLNVRRHAAALPGAELAVAELDWAADAEAQLAALGGRGDFDVVIASDVLYHGLARPLMETVQRLLLRPGGEMWVAHQRRWASVMRLDSVDAEELVDVGMAKFSRWRAGAGAELDVVEEEEVSEEYVMLRLGWS